MAGFLNKVVTGINKSASAVNESSKLLVEKGKLNIQVQNLEKEKNTMITELGKAVLDLYKKDMIKLDDCIGIVNNIITIEENMLDLKKQIEAIGEEMAGVKKDIIPSVSEVCSCGHVNKTDAKFCVKCGKPVGKKPNTSNNPNNASANEIICSCGQVNTKGANFCIKCGKALEQQNENETAEQQ